MPIRFAPADCLVAARISSGKAQDALSKPANDNGTGYQFDGALQTALRHFAKHGLDAARDARRQAEAAFFAGNRDDYNRWLGVCRVIDQRMAREVALMTKPPVGCAP